MYTMNCYNCGEKAIFRTKDEKKYLFCSKECQKHLHNLIKRQNLKIGQNIIPTNTTIQNPHNSNEQYTLISPINFGAFGQVWTANDNNNNKVFMKIQNFVRPVIRQGYIREVYIQKLINKFNNENTDLCAETTRCAKSSFVIELDNKTYGIIVFPGNKEVEPIDLFTFVAGEFNEDTRKYNILPVNVLLQELSELPNIESLYDKMQVKIILELVKDIQSLHNAGIAHRDIKPENILLDYNIFRIALEKKLNIVPIINKYKSIMIDFGLSVPLKQDQEVFFDDTGNLRGIKESLSDPEWDSKKIPLYIENDPMVGTVLYLDPTIYTGKNEKWSNEQLIANDKFAIAVVMYFLEKGKLPRDQTLDLKFVPKVNGGPFEKLIEQLTIPEIDNRISLSDVEKQLAKELENIKKKGF